MKKILMFLMLFISPFSFAGQPYPGAWPNTYTLYLDSSVMNDVVLLQGFSYLDPNAKIECQIMGNQPKFPDPGTLACYPINVTNPDWTIEIDGLLEYTINGILYTIPESFWYDPKNQNPKSFVHNKFLIYKLNGVYFWQEIV